MKKIGIICKSGKEKPNEILEKLLPWLIQKGYEAFVDPETAEQLNISGLSLAEISSVADIVIVFGGDGTMLSVSRLVAEREVPILGINLGSLGFITEISRENLCLRFTAFFRIIAAEWLRFVQKSIRKAGISWHQTLISMCSVGSTARCFWRRRSNPARNSNNTGRRRMRRQ